jgi:hypothetical protein
LGKRVLRRDALALLGGLAGLAACGVPRAASETPPPPPPPPERLKLDPIVDVVPAAGLVWLIDARPHELIKDAIFGPVMATILPASRLETFAERHGGLDVRAAAQLAVAGYPHATLVLARIPFEPERVQEAFGARVGRVEGRAVEQGVTTIWGNVPHAREQLALMRGDAIAFEHGQLGPLRAAVYFAQGRLRRSSPALLAEPLASAAAVAGDAPLRIFAPGPFEGQWARGAAGLLGASTAVVATFRPMTHGPGGAVAVRVVLMGGWGSDGAAAAERLRSAFGVLAEDALGQMLGMDHPIDGPVVAADADALRLEVALDAAVLARGIHVAVDASVAEIMGY